MNSEIIEIYHSRGVSNLGLWDIAGLKFKVYGLVADNKAIDQGMLILAQSFVQLDVLPCVADEGGDNVSISIGSFIPLPSRWTQSRGL